jgi:hypothetical protein
VGARLTFFLPLDLPAERADVRQGRLRADPIGVPVRGRGIHLGLVVTGGAGVPRQHDGVRDAQKPTAASRADADVVTVIGLQSTGVQVAARIMPSGDRARTRSWNAYQ